MIQSFLRSFIHNRAQMIAPLLLLVFAGVHSFQTLPIDAVPDVTNNQIQINTPIDGLSTEEVERRITFPLETSMRGIAGANLVRSFTRFNLSQVTVIFDEDVDVYRARQMVGERLLSLASTLPAGALPRMGPISSGLGEIYHYTIVLEHPEKFGTPVQQLMAIRELQDWTIKPLLRTVKGVADVNSIGGYEKQFHISPDPKKMAHFGLQFDELIGALNRTNKAVGAGMVRHRNEQFLVQSNGLLKSIEDIERVPISLLNNFQMITISDVAQVHVATELRPGAATVNGQEAVVGTVMMLMGENTRIVAKRVGEKISEIQKTLPPEFRIVTLYDRSDLVNATISTVEHNLFVGAALVILVLLLLGGNLRAALITAVIIPFTLLFTFLGMKLAGISGNLMSLGALDFGIIVDGVVILIDHCVRVIDLRGQAKGHLTPSEIKTAVYEATTQIAKIASLGQMTIMLVFLPILSFENVEGKMFRPLAITFVIAVLGALGLSFTLGPALAGIFLRYQGTEKPRIMQAIESTYNRIMQALLVRPLAAISSAAVLTLGGCLLFFTLGGEFLPQLDEGSILFECVKPIRISLDHSLKLQMLSEKIVAKYPEVLHTFSKIGTAEISNDPQWVNSGDLYVMLKPRESWPLINGKKRTKPELISAMLQELKEAVPDQMILPNQPIQNRFNDLLEGTRGDISIKIFGDDLEVLGELSKKIRKELQGIRGAGEVGMELRGTSTVLSILPNDAILRKLGISNGEVLETVGVALGGADAGYVYDNVKRFPIIIKLNEKDRSDLDLIRKLPVGFSTHGTVPLEEAAIFKSENVFNEIRREEGRRRTVVMLSTLGRDIETYVAEAKSVIAKKVPLPPGYELHWGGSFANLQKAKLKLAIAIPAALIAVFSILFVFFGSWTEAALVFVCVPFGLVGGVMGLMAAGLHFSISAGVGFIAIIGVTVLNGFLLVTHYRELEKDGLKGSELVVKGTTERLRPIFMTALVDIFGCLPMLLSSGVGSELQRPLASVVIGGILLSTLLCLLIFPLLYSRFVLSKQN